MKLLKAVLQHRTVYLVEHVQPDLDLIVRPDSENVRVEGRVVKFAQRQPIRNDGMSLRGPVWQDVRGFEKLLVA
jgi:hypothetical protein